MLIDEAVGVGEDESFRFVIAGCHRPSRDRLDLLLRDTEVPQGLAVLGEDELASRRPPGPDLAQLAKDRIKSSIRALVQGETSHSMLEDFGDESEDGPPVTGRAGPRAW